jgi:osmotically-inducible protein OsmY
MIDDNAHLEQRVHQTMAKNPFLAQRALTFEADRGRVIIKGIVGTFYQKQMAQEAVRHVDGVEGIENQLEVSW